MPARQLPPELLTVILSNLSSSPSDLYHSLLVSHTFAALVKPILYRTVVIESQSAFAQISNARREDVRRIRKLTIKGCGDVEPEDLVEHFVDDHCTLGNASLVQGLLTGEWLDLSVMETLHIRDVHEDPRIVRSLENFRAAPNLVELSIWNHQGGARIWSTYLNKGKLPSLRRLGFHEVSLYRTERRESETAGDSERRHVSEVEVQPCRNIPYSQLEVLVAACPENFETIPDFPVDGFLSLRRYPVSLQKQVNNSIRNFRPFYSRTEIYHFIDDWFEDIQKLSIPSTSDSSKIRFFFCGCPYRLSPSIYRYELHDIVAKGSLVIDEIDAEEEARSVGEEGENFERTEMDDLTSLIFPLFVDSLRRAGKLRD